MNYSESTNNHDSVKIATLLQSILSPPSIHACPATQEQTSSTMHATVREKPQGPKYRKAHNRFLSQNVKPFEMTGVTQDGKCQTQKPVIVFNERVDKSDNFMISEDTSLNPGAF